MSYKIMRHYLSFDSRTIRRGLTLAQAEAHVADPESNSRDSRSAPGQKRVALLGVWFDEYEPESP